MNTKNKIVTLPALKRKISGLRRGGKRIAFTNGCFDVIHFGHVSYLQTAKKNNRVLIVGLNSDPSVRKIKGRKRPIVPQKERAAILAALACVDYVVLFNEETPIKLIQALKPDILIKGADWRGKSVVGSDFIKANRGKLEYVKYLPSRSTTNVIKAILKKCAK